MSADQDTFISPDLEVEYFCAADKVGRVIRSPVGGSKQVLGVDGSGTAKQPDPRQIWACSSLREKRRRLNRGNRAGIGTITVADLFSGAGGLSLGTHHAIQALGYRPRSLLAVDVDSDAVSVNQFNNLVSRTYVGSVRDLFSANELARTSKPRGLKPSASIYSDSRWLAGLSVDILVGGPPCQGHSSLNNHTRGRDDRNQLYFWMAVAAHALQAKIVIIENVPTVMRDAGEVVTMTHQKLEQLGYVIVLADTLSADAMGIAQTRRRHFTVAIREDVLGQSPEFVQDCFRKDILHIPALSIMDVIGDLEDAVEADEYNSPSVLSQENIDRIDYLFDNGLHNLPDDQRPKAHQDGHSYPSVYGRMYEDRPAGTLTTGFLSPGRGRYIHPTRRRTLTLHEGARVQGFPDSFRFWNAMGEMPTRTAIARMIGDAVPPPMAFQVALTAIAATKRSKIFSK